MLPSRDTSGQLVPVERRVIVEGEDLINAQPGFDQRTSQPIVNFRFNMRGAQRFGAATTENVGRPLAIVLDNEVISSPLIQTPITGGSGQISGRFSVQQANDLAVLLRAGALPAKLTIVEERTVGPGLGATRSRPARWRRCDRGGARRRLHVRDLRPLRPVRQHRADRPRGVDLRLMSVLGATLTLPGIAGIVLTIGTAVDSNVLIYERIREESRLGPLPIVGHRGGLRARVRHDHRLRTRPC